MNIADYTLTHTERGECVCGQCIDRGDRPDPSGHTVDMVFFKVALRGDEPKERMRADFERLMREHPGESVDPFDGAEHGYIELGGWLGDQQVALRFMALGTLLGVFKLLSPLTILGSDAPPDLVHQMAGAGYITVVPAT